MGQGKSLLPVMELDKLHLERVCAHGGAGEIGFCRVFTRAQFVGPWNFVDYAVLPPGASIGRHRHGPNEEMYLVLSGRGRMTRDHEEFAVQAGSVIVNRAGGEHSLTNVGSEPLKLFVVEIALSGEPEAQ